MARKETDYIKDYYGKIIRSLPENVYVKSKAGAILACSDAQAKAVGLKNSNEMIGKTAYDTLPKEQADAITALDSKIMLLGKSEVIEEISLRADGKHATYFSHKIPLKDERGEVIGLLGVSFDITDRKETEKALRLTKDELKQANRAKTDFLRTVRHEIAGKLSTVVGLSELLKDLLKNQSDEILEAINAISFSAYSITPILDRIENYLSLESGNLKSLLDVVNLRDLIENFEQKYANEIFQRNIKISFAFDEEIPSYILTDYNIIYEVIDNLIRNAIRYTNNGSIKVFIKLDHEGKKQEDNYLVDVIVQDTGRGIPLETQQHLFDLFEIRKEEDKYISPGFNLSVSKKLAHILKGDIFLESEEGKGSVFTFSFFVKPLLDLEKPTFSSANRLRYEEILSSISIDEELKRKEHIKILLVEDDSMTRFTLEKLLKANFHCQIISVSKLSEAKSQLEKSKNFDLVLTDISLPDGEGHLIMKTLESLYPKDSFPFVVAITAQSRDLERDIFLNLGILDVIPKPFSLIDLEKVVVGLFGEAVKIKQ